MTAIVLAGGRSSRFGRPKLDEPLDGVTLLEHAIRAVAPLAGEIVIAGPSIEGDRGISNPVAPLIAAPSGTMVRTVHDPESFGGPLVGLATALATMTTPFALVIGGDMPSLQPAVLEAMLLALTLGEVPEGRERRDAVVLAQAQGPHPLPCALRTVAARHAATVALGRGVRSLRGMLGLLEMYALPEATWRLVDPLGASLVDVDRPEDLDRVPPR